LNMNQALGAGAFFSFWFSPYLSTASKPGDIQDLLTLFATPCQGKLPQPAAH